MNNRLPSVMELYISSTCNLKCSYCYISKNEWFFKYDKEILQLMKDNSYFELMKELYEGSYERLTSLELWGGEPLLSLSLLTKHIHKYLDLFPRLSKIFIPTNFTININDLIDFIKQVDNYRDYRDKRCITVMVQVSSDGSPEVTNYGRISCSGNIDVADTIEKNLNYFCSEVDKKIFNTRVIVNFKSTLSMEVINKLLNTDEKMLKYFSYNYELINKLKSFSKVIFSQYPVPGIVMGTDGYTQKDGLIFNDYTCRLLELRKRNIKDNILPGYNTFHYMLKKDWLEHFLNLYRLGNLDFCSYGCCTGYTEHACLLPDKRLSVCHRACLDDSDEYLNYISDSYSDDDDLNSYIKSIHMHGRKYYTVSFDDIKNSSIHMDKIYSLLDADNHVPQTGIRMANALSLIRELSECNQISGIYKREEKWRILAALFLRTYSSCLYENIVGCGSLIIQEPSMYRLYLNGAFENIVNDHLNSTNGVI